MAARAPAGLPHLARECFSVRAADGGGLQLHVDGSPADACDVDVLATPPLSKQGRTIAAAIDWLLGDESAAVAADYGLVHLCGVAVFATPNPAPPMAASAAQAAVAAGLDTTARIDALSFCAGRRCLVIHRASNAFGSPALRRLLQGWRTPTWVLCGPHMHLVGAVMHSDPAFGTPPLQLHGGVDSIHWHSSVGRLPVPRTLGDVEACARNFNRRFRASLLSWEVPAGVDAWPWSSWRTLDDLQRLAVCAGAAFAAYHLGRAAVCSDTIDARAMIGAPPMAATDVSVARPFSHRPLGTALAARAAGASGSGSSGSGVLSLALNRLQEHRALKIAQLRTTIVPVAKLQLTLAAVGKVLEVTCGVYDKRLRKRGPVYLSTTSAVPAMFLSGTVMDVRARIAVVVFDESHDTSLAAIVAMWRASPKSVEVATDNHSDSDLVLSVAASAVAFDLVTPPAIVDSAPLPGAAATAATAGSPAASGAILGGCADWLRLPARWAWAASLGAPLPLHPVLPPLGDDGRPTPKDAARLAQLNASQAAALRNAHNFPVSIIRGPPGTGKTRTISAITESLVDAGHRVMLLAPANAATFRLLQALLDHGYDDSALVICEEYYAWHSHRYTRSLPNVITPAVHAKSSAAALDQQSALSAADMLRLSKWVDADYSIKRVPPAVILTFGSMINLFAGGPPEPKLHTWTAIARAIVSLSTIDTVIIDEASQLWEGHMHALASLLPWVTRFVFVGDDEQLPPFGSDQARCRSAFDALVANEHVPLQMLQTSYRLPSSVVGVLSHHLYNDALGGVRNAARDAEITAGIKRAAALTVMSASTTACIRRYLAGQSLTWLHLAGGAVVKSADTQSPANEVEAKAVARIACDLWCIVEAATRYIRGFGFAAAAAVKPPAAGAAAAAAAASSDDGTGTVTAAADDGSTTTPLVIITPYEHQRHLIERLLAQYIAMRKGVDESKVLKELQGRRVATCIDGYQGQEAEFVLVSLVNNDTIGFLRDDRRANVMLSRCRQGMIIVGNWYAPTLNAPGSLLDAMAQHCRATDALIGEDDGVVTTPVALTSSRGGTNFRWLAGREPLSGVDSDVTMLTVREACQHGDTTSPTSERLPSSAPPHRALSVYDFPPLPSGTGRMARAAASAKALAPAVIPARQGAFGVRISGSIGGASLLQSAAAQIGVLQRTNVVLEAQSRQLRSELATAGAASAGALPHAGARTVAGSTTLPALPAAAGAMRSWASIVRSSMTIGAIGCQWTSFNPDRGAAPATRPAAATAASAATTHASRARVPFFASRGPSASALLATALSPPLRAAPTTSAALVAASPSSPSHATAPARRPLAPSVAALFHASAPPASSAIAAGGVAPAAAAPATTARVPAGLLGTQRAPARPGLPYRAALSASPAARVPPAAASTPRASGIPVAGAGTALDDGDAAFWGGAAAAAAAAAPASAAPATAWRATPAPAARGGPLATEAVDSDFDLGNPFNLDPELNAWRNAVVGVFRRRAVRRWESGKVSVLVADLAADAAIADARCRPSGPLDVALMMIPDIEISVHRANKVATMHL